MVYSDKDCLKIKLTYSDKYIDMECAKELLEDNIQYVLEEINNAIQKIIKGDDNGI